MKQAIISIVKAIALIFCVLSFSSIPLNAQAPPAGGGGGAPSAAVDLSKTYWFTGNKNNCPDQAECDTSSPITPQTGPNLISLKYTSQTTYVNGTIGEFPNGVSNLMGGNGSNYWFPCDGAAPPPGLSINLGDSFCPPNNHNCLPNIPGHYFIFLSSENIQEGAGSDGSESGGEEEGQTQGQQDGGK